MDNIVLSLSWTYTMNVEENGREWRREGNRFFYLIVKDVHYVWSSISRIYVV